VDCSQRASITTLRMPRWHDICLSASHAFTETGFSSGADGLTVDAKGRLYVASTDGVQVFDSKGQALGALPKLFRFNVLRLS